MLPAGRKGVKKSDVDYLGRVKGAGGSSGYTKQEADSKFETKTNIGGFQFREEDGVAQYRTSETGEWVNFSKGGGVGIVLDNPITDEIVLNGCSIIEGGYQKIGGIVYVNVLVNCDTTMTGTWINLPKVNNDKYVTGVSTNIPIFALIDDKAGVVITARANVTFSFSGASQGDVSIYSPIAEGNHLRILAVYPCIM